MVGSLRNLTPPYQMISEISNPRNGILYHRGNSDPASISQLFEGMNERFAVPPMYTEFNSTISLDRHLASFESQDIYGGILFYEFDVAKRKFNYTIMYNSSDFSVLQLNHAISYGIHKLLGGESELMRYAFLQVHAKTNPQIVIFLQSGPYLLSFGLSVLITVFVQGLVEEKEKLIKDQLLIV